MCECLVHEEGDLYLCPVCAGMVREGLALALARGDSVIRQALTELHRAVPGLERLP